MRIKELRTINLELKSIEDLFLEPEFNPLDSESRSQSGIAELMEQVRDLNKKEPLKINIFFTSPPDDADMETLANKAINRFCSVKIRECEQAIYELRSQGKRDFVSALLLSLILVLGEYFAVQLRFLPEFLTYLLATGFGIIAWVVLWPPLDKLLYEWRPCRRSQQIFKYIQAAELEIKIK